MIPATLVFATSDMGTELTVFAGELSGFFSFDLISFL
jgi:hypothetical protein